MKTKQVTWALATVFGLACGAGPVQAATQTSEQTAAKVTAQPAAQSKADASKPAAKTSAKRTIRKKTTRKKAVKKVVVAKPKPEEAKIEPAVPAKTEAAQPVQPAAATGWRTANPYLSGVPYQNPYLVNQKPNPYLSMPQITNSNFFQTKERKHITFSPLPLDIYMNPGMRPAVAFTTPCVKIEKLTNGFPPILAFENFMFDTIGKINASEALPFSIEPVCT